ncbi:TadE/TadG family type IV pilus assembly protein [Mahella australiensis]|uniref:TadE-like domain-containing protein n=1 Tax=Mahella australiensis (strain DSM 15567 / CIP 107919 / 50-1 BON) TaxID=697281 RepID=F3ZWU7_MAHA5|nr:TadE family protein [Mahella australiensis]AEE97569.1 hypothetical protein Mahau_2405 [Mahella australiensis 50-1 BON]
MSGLKKLIRDKRGFTSTITFIVLLPFIMAFVIAMAQLTIIGIGQTTVNNAAFEGARAGVRSASPVNAAIQAANKYGSGILHDWDSKATVTARSSGDTVTVTVKYAFPKYAYFNMNGIDIGTIVQSSSSQLIEDRP